MKTERARRRWRADSASLMRVLYKVAPFKPDALVQIELPPRLAYQSMKDGEGTETDYNTLAQAINDTLMRSEDISPYCVEVCETAANAMRRCEERFRHTGRFGFDGLGMQEISAALDLYSEVLVNSTPAQMLSAAIEQQRRQRARIATETRGTK